MFTRPGRPGAAQAAAARRSAAAPRSVPRCSPAAGRDRRVRLVLKAPPEDPLAKANQTSYEVLQTVDDKFVGPVASGYQKSVPRPLRMALRNFIRNVREPVAVAAYLLELKPGKAFETVAPLRDQFDDRAWRRRLRAVEAVQPALSSERPGQCAGLLRRGPGPYLFLPLVGPTTVRDLFGLVADRLAVPLAVGTPFDKPCVCAADGRDRRARLPQRGGRGLQAAAQRRRSLFRPTAGSICNRGSTRSRRFTGAGRW